MQTRRRTDGDDFLHARIIATQSQRHDRAERAQRLRLGLPWRLPHYHPLNGPHPLVDSFVRGNPLIDSVELPAGTPAQPVTLQTVLLNLTQQARAIPHEQTGRFIEWLKLGDQLTIEAQAERYDALFLHTTPL